MKRLIPLLNFLLIQLSLMLSAQNTNDIKVIRGERPPIDLNSLTEDAYEKDIVLIKFNKNSGKLLEGNGIKNDGDGTIRFGFENVDALCKQFSIGNAVQLFFSIASKNGFTTKHKAWGFGRWYKLKTDDQTDIIALVQAFQKLDEIETAEPEYKKVPVWKTGAVIQHPDQDKTIPNSKWTPNDPLFDQQWHYHNTGQSGGQSGADIDLLNAWDIEKGNPNVIVAVIDGGIQFDHPDLAANMWSGLGYNFVDNTSIIEPHDHGTHVAGTIAAVSNNGSGLAGIAGGSGSGDGVRLMSCQVYTATSNGGHATAMVWAADNGAAIAQNSWGYIHPNVYNQAVLDAIDYFNANGGGSVMNGGITIFAAGNDNSSLAYYPAFYTGTMSVAATNNLDEKAWYSNFGNYVDISAPGGETNQNAEKGVFSTITGNSNAFYQGTSMACPHVSGAAALLLSYATRNTIPLSSSELWTLLTGSTDNHYPQNPGFSGQLGSGRLNAFTSLSRLSGLPKLSTTVVSSITPNSAISGGNISDGGGSAVTACGVVWGLSTRPTILLNAGLTNNGTGTGSFTSTITNLIADKTYYLRAYATNSSGTAYGEEISFSTSVLLPTVNTTAITSITQQSAISGGLVSDYSAGEIIARGIVWSTSPNPTISANEGFTADGTGLGEFTSNLTGLSPDNTYYVRAYATKSTGTSYGDELTFSTAILLPEVTTAYVSSISFYSALSGGNVTDQSAFEVIARGLVWSTSQNPTLTTNEGFTIDGNGLGSFTSELTGLTPDVQYYVRAYATKSIGTAYGEEHSFTTLSELPVVFTRDITSITNSSAISGGNITFSGADEITACGVVWSNLPNPTVENNSGITNDGSGIGNFISHLSGLTYNTMYYLRAYASNSFGSAYGEEISFVTINCGVFTDVRDGESYNAVLIGNQCWMAENLKYLPEVHLAATGSRTLPHYYVYGYNGIDVNAAKATANYQNYGVLYNWTAAMTGLPSSNTNPSGVQGVCPDGWHIPSSNEWTQLLNYIGSRGFPNTNVINGAGNALRSCRKIDSPITEDCNTSSHPRWEADNANHGFDEFGFGAMPGGVRYAGNYNNLGNDGDIWAATQTSTNDARNYNITSYRGDVRVQGNDKANGYSVRCVKSPVTPPPTYNLNIEITPAGSGNVTGVGLYPEGTIISVLANPKWGWQFINWTDEDNNIVSNQAIFTYAMPAANITLTANFVENQSPTDNFVTKWNLSYENSTSISFYATVADYKEAYYIWSQESGTESGSGKLAPGTSLRTISGLPQGSEIVLQIYPANLKRFFFEQSLPNANHLLTDVLEWGNVEWKSMENAFKNCSRLNITATDVPYLSQVKSMRHMFNSCFRLKGPNNIGSWDVSNAVDMESLFGLASAFDRYLGDWALNPSVNLTGMLDYTGLTCHHYSTTLIAWNNNPNTPNRRLLGAKGLKYGTNAVAARNSLITNKSWTINGDGPSGVDCSNAIYTLTLVANPVSAGVTTGSGQYQAGSQINLTATPYQGWGFINWTDVDGNEISDQANFTYTLPNANTTLNANFEETTGGFICGQLFTDPRDGNTYKTVQIGNQCWTENMKYLPMVNTTSGNSETLPYYYVAGYTGTDLNEGKATANYQNYGVLYNWPATMNGAATSSANPSGVKGVCPSGWHIPSDAEWTQLVNFVAAQGYPNENVQTGAGNALKSCRQVNSPLGGDCNTSVHPRWNQGNYGFDAFDFAALPGSSIGGGGSPGNSGLWYSSTQSATNTSSVLTRQILYTWGNVTTYLNPKSYGQSVRCIRDLPASAILPSIITMPVINISTHTATSGGHISDNGGAEVTARGLVWSTTPFPTLQNNLGNTNNGSGAGEFSSNITGLSLNTSYYVRAYATNSIGTVYSESIKFKTSTGVLTLSTTPLTLISSNSAVSGGTITDDGGTPIITRGVVWSTSQNPTYDNNEGITYDGAGTGDFTSNLTGILPVTTYYVRAYAVNSGGPSYGNELSFTTVEVGAFVCGLSSVTFIYRGSEVTYETVVGANNKCWLDRNLGAVRAAQSSTDSDAYGDLFQWGRLSDGHQVRTSSTTSVRSNTDIPGHGNYITSGSNPYDWRNPQNNDLWQGVNGVNNPCPDNWRLPTSTELNNERLSWDSNNAAGAFSSPLKLPLAGSRSTNGGLNSNSTDSYYWSNTVSGTSSNRLVISGSTANLNSSYRAEGYSVRCIYSPAYNLNLEINPSGAGEATGAGQYEEGTQIIIAASENTGYQFVNWTDEDNNVVSNQISFSYTMPACNVTLTANYDASSGFLILSTTPVTSITFSSAISGGNITDDGGSEITARGVVWGTSENPTVETNEGITYNGTGKGVFTSSMTGLIPGTSYFTRAYAINSDGASYGDELGFTTVAASEFLCGTSTVTFTYKGTEVTYGTVVGTNSKCWLDRNLGASRVAISSTDAEAYGDLFQWGRPDDGHQLKTSPTTSTKSNVDLPGHGNFITASSSPYDWRSPQNNNLWQGVDGVNNPCPEGWRLPTDSELNNEQLSWSSNNATGAFSSSLKLPMAGARNANGTLNSVGSIGRYWSASIDGINSWQLRFNSTSSSVNSYQRATGYSVRCIREATSLPIFDLNLELNPSEAGSTTGAGQYTEGASLSISATANSGWQFVNWTDEATNVISNQASFTYTMPAANTTLTANFVEIPVVLPTLTTTTATNITSSTATSGGNITSDGGAAITSRGLVWSTFQNPTVITNEGITNDGTGSGLFTSNLSGLTPTTTYYLRAYATNIAGTAYGAELNFTTAQEGAFLCGTSNVTFTYNGSPVTYGTVVGTDGKCWLDRNLGATQVATSSTDAAAYGDLFQWGRFAEGHQLRSSAIHNAGLANTSAPNAGNNWDGKFISSGSSPWDWQSPQDVNLWQITGATNNPCPEGWRLPTEAELDDERLSWTGNNAAGAFASPLKWSLGGYRGYDANATLGSIGTAAYIWTSTTGSDMSRRLAILAQDANFNSARRANGMSVRCIKPIKYALNLESAPIEGGSITGTDFYEAGQLVSITATANPGWQFVNWTDEAANVVSSQASFVYIMPAANVTLTANFEEEILSWVPCPGSPTVTDIDGNVYNTVLIGSQCWTKENLKVTRDAVGNAISRICYETTENCNHYGGLYSWPTAINSLNKTNGKSHIQGICPTGWHLPSQAEWQQLQTLLHFAGHQNYNHQNGPANALKSCRQQDSPLEGDCNTTEHPYWQPHTNFGFDAYGFSALPGGRGWGNGSFNELGYTANFWSSTEYGLSSAIRASIYNSDGAFSLGDWSREMEYSVRCVKDEVYAMLPLVLTYSVTNIGSSDASCSGNIPYDGGAPVTARGVVWSTTQSPTLGNNNGFTSDGTGTGDFSSSITGLSPSTTYYLRAYATNSIGTFYGDQVEFTTLPANRTLEAKILLEGAFNGSNGMHASLKTAGMIPLAQPYNTSPWDYNGSESVATIPADVVDWVLVELRDATTPETATAATILAGWPKAMFLKNDGSLLGLDGNPPAIGNPSVNNNLYIVIRHRNHLDVMSSAALTLSGNTYSYDFTDDVTKAHGGAAGYKSLGNGKFGMVAGDIDADGAVFASDFNIWAINFGLTTVYLPADVDMDGQVFTSDFNKWAVNFGTNTGDKQKVHYQSQVP